MPINAMPITPVGAPWPLASQQPPPPLPGTHAPLEPSAMHSNPPGHVLSLPVVHVIEHSWPSSLVATQSPDSQSAPEPHDEPKPIGEYGSRMHCDSKHSWPLPQ